MHRLSTLRGIDRVLVVDHAIAEKGARDRLMQQGGVYAGLYEAQFQVEAVKIR